MSWFVRESECNAYKQVLREENRRQNRRIEILEETLRSVRDIAIEIQKLTSSMGHMIEEQKDQGARLQRLEDAAEDKTWAHIKKRALETAVMVASTALVIGLIMIMANNIK